MSIDTRRAYAALVLTAALATGCNMPAAGSRLSQVDCPKEAVAGRADIDLSGTGRSKALIEERLVIVEDLLRWASACSAPVSIVAFAGRVADAVTVFEGNITPRGATFNARLRKVEQSVADAMEIVRTSLKTATAKLPPNGSDIVGELDLIAEHAEQVGRRTRAVLLTDGQQTVGSAKAMSAATLTREQAIDLADEVEVVQLNQVDLQVVGIGVVADDRPATSWSQAAKVFWSRLCKKAEARSCLIAQDLAAVTS